MKTVLRSGRSRKQWGVDRCPKWSCSSWEWREKETPILAHSNNTEDGMPDTLHYTTEYLVGTILASTNPPAVFRLIRYLDSRLHSTYTDSHNQSTSRLWETVINSNPIGSILSRRPDSMAFSLSPCQGHSSCTALSTNALWGSRDTNRVKVWKWEWQKCFVIFI